MDEFKNATQRPWRAEVNSAKTLAQIFGNRGFGDWILNMEVEDQDGLAALGDGELANLALIVRAVNAYGPMREALETAKRKANGILYADDALRVRVLARQMIDAVSAALRAADGEASDG